MSAIQLPPVFFYGIGAMLIVFGALRAYHLGWSRRRAAAGASEDAEEEASSGSRRGSGYTAKRHIVWGLVWIGLGLFLVISTAVNTPR
jgi:hypothetical protein